MSLDEVIRRSRIVICCGSGGVGKTSVAAAIALEAASGGRRAVVVTIDPARRLADTLGLAGLSNTPRRLRGRWDGELWAMMLDTKRTFDALVTARAADAEQADQILENRFYRNISSALSGTQEYMAMEKLYELHDEADFDLVVVDTPPTRNALDFLDAPNRITRFLDHRLYRVVTAPTRGVVRAFGLAAQTFLRSVGRVVGSEVIDEAIAFFQAFGGMEEGFKQRARRVMDLLADDATSFVLVASPRRDTVEEATYFADKLRESDLAVGALVVNRLHPGFGGGLAEAASARAATLDGTELGSLYRALADFQIAAAREERHFADLARRVDPAPVVRVPFLECDVSDLDSLGQLAGHVFSGGSADMTTSGDRSEPAAGGP